MVDGIKGWENEGGFTLIELMIVMTILGVLGGIVLFSVGTFDTDAQATKSVTNDRMCATADAAALATVDPTDDAGTFATGC